ncbi:MAG: alpha/beta fold hydrolase [Collimonas pratensis]|uniref:alpha/beta fold hydrolase n=1 Tax=Collimonas pratensis TaxID=279113 RepID=UPI003C787EE0
MAPTDSTRQLQAAIERLNARFAERSVDVGGSAVSYRSCGAEAAEKTVVLLHGIGSGAASWLHCALALESDARVIAWNAPGYGASSPLPMAHPSAADYAGRLGQFLQAMEIDKCILVGHSLGAMMASAYMAQGSGRVAQPLLISPAQGYGGDDKCVRGREIAQQRLAALDDPGIDGMARKSPERMLSPQAGQLARDWVRWNTQKLHPAGYTQAVYMLCGDDIQRYLSAVAGLPAARAMAVYCGADDIVTTPQESRALAEVFQLPFQLIEAAGHACHIEQPQAVAAVIRRHLDQLS